jgi:hypothetical protein
MLKVRLFLIAVLPALCLGGSPTAPAAAAPTWLDPYREPASRVIAYVAAEMPERLK